MMRGYDYGYGQMMGGGWWGLLAGLFWLAVLAGIVILVIWAVRQFTRGSHGHDAGHAPYTGQARRDEACEIARIRYAKGEISREQYAEICHGLGVPGPPPAGPPQGAPGAYHQPPQAPPPPPQAPRTATARRLVGPADPSRCRVHSRPCEGDRAGVYAAASPEPAPPAALSASAARVAR